MAVPRSAEPSVLRALGSYLRSAPKTDLPPGLRPLAGRHQKMLAREKDRILAALDDSEALRALIVEWLDDRPSLDKRDAELLRLAAARPNGWEERLAEAAGSATAGRAATGRGASKQTRKQARKKASPRRSGGTARDESDRLAQATERAKKAREEARKVRADADKDKAQAERRIATLTTQVEELTARGKALEKDLSAARKESEAARREAERETRKARRRVDDAQAAATKARKELRDARTEIRRLEASRETKSAKTTRKPAGRKPRSAPAPPERRSVLRAPKGLLNDAPETLEEWLRADDVSLLIDGYNVSKARGGFGDLSLETQRRRLIDEVGKLARRAEIEATIVFDGSEVAPGTRRRPRGPVKVEYSRADEIADDHLIAKLEAMPNYPVIVVTNDKELQHRARRLGATVARSDQLLALIR